MIRRVAIYLPALLVLIFGLCVRPVTAQVYTIGGQAVYALHEGESAHIPFVNLLSTDLPIAVLIGGNPDHFQVSTDSAELPLFHDSLFFMYGAGKATLNCRYFPRSERPDTIYLYIHARLGSQADTVMVYSVDTSAGAIDTTRTKPYFHANLDTVRLDPQNTTKSVILSNYAFGDMLGYCYVSAGSHQFIVPNQFRITSPHYDYHPGSITIGYDDTLGYGHFDTATIVLYPYLPLDAMPDTIIACFEHNVASVDITMPDFRSVPASVNTCKKAFITNPHDVALRVVSLSAVSAANRLTIDNAPSVPFDLAPHQRVPVTLCFAAPAKGNARIPLTLSAELEPFDHTQNSNSVGTTEAWIDDHCVLAAPDTLRFRWIKPYSYAEDTVRITNKLSVPLNTSAPMWDSTSGDTSLFSILIPLTSFTLPRGASHLLRFRFHAPAEVGEYGMIFYYNFDADQSVDTNCTVRRVQLIGRVSLSDSLDVAGESPSPTQVTISPNPTTTVAAIRLTGGRATVAEVFDVLGNRVTTLAAGSQWQWRAEEALASSGVYYLRLQGFADNGRPFVRTERIVVNR